MTQTLERVKEQVYERPLAAFCCDFVDALHYLCFLDQARTNDTVIVINVRCTRQRRSRGFECTASARNHRIANPRMPGWNAFRPWTQLHIGVGEENRPNFISQAVIQGSQGFTNPAELRASHRTWVRWEAS
jgi:hypothetical protein